LLFPTKQSHVIRRLLRLRTSAPRSDIIHIRIAAPVNSGFLEIHGIQGKRNSPVGNDSAYPGEGPITGKITDISSIFAWNLHQDAQIIHKVE
jgi:hypothetical protein